MKKKSKFIWVYSIVLFSVAFVLILFSSFTGIRYKNEHTETKALYQGAQNSVLQLTDENERLQKENNEKQSTIDKLTAENNELRSIGEKSASEKQKYVDAAENLLKAQDLLNAGNKTAAKEVFDSIDSSILGENTLKLYEKLSKKF